MLEIETFSNVTHSESGELNGGVYMRVFFASGFGVSVIQSPLSYGGSCDKYELAVIEGNPVNWHITYDTHITNDVLGWLDEDQVIGYMRQVSKL